MSASQTVSPISVTSPIATQARSNSESSADLLVQSVPDLLKDTLTSKLNEKKRSISPLAKNDTTPNVSPKSEGKGTGKVSRTVLTKCPCGKSTGGQSWLLKCTSCTQCWHNVCVNLKGNIPKSTVDQIDLWQCPWCYSCPLLPPKTHESENSCSSATHCHQ